MTNEPPVPVLDVEYVYTGDHDRYRLISLDDGDGRYILAGPKRQIVMSPICFQTVMRTEEP